MTGISIRTAGRAGLITLDRPQALNALTWDMVTAMTDALTRWRNDPDVAVVLIDGAGDRAFCAGGDIAEMYATGTSGDLDYGRRFWRDEYRLNALMSLYHKPIVSFLHGFTMGGGVGVGCHARHRVVSETSQIAMPECGIGLVPDVGGSLILARAPGHLGEYLGLTGDRMDAGDAIYSGFADHLIPQSEWVDLKAALTESGDARLVARTAHPAPQSRLAAWQGDIDQVFGAQDLGALLAGPSAVPSAPIAHALDLMDKNSPLSMACSLSLIRAVRADPTIVTALDHEYRFTHRAMAQGDFLEGIRAALIDRDRTPHWRHADRIVPASDIAAMTAPLGSDALDLKDLT